MNNFCNTHFSLNFFRLINLVANSSLENRLIQSHVEHLRIEYLVKHTDLTCEQTRTNKKFIPLQYIKIHFDKLSKIIGDQNFDETNRNLSKKDINLGAEFFIALNSCPSMYEKLYWKAIYGNKSRIAKFASNIIRKAKDGFKVRAQKIFAKISSVIGFQHISYRHEGNRSTAMNIELSKNMLDIKGIVYFSCLI